VDWLTECFWAIEMIFCFWRAVIYRLILARLGWFLASALILVAGESIRLKRFLVKKQTPREIKVAIVYPYQNESGITLNIRYLKALINLEYITTIPKKLVLATRGVLLVDNS